MANEENKPVVPQAKGAAVKRTDKKPGFFARVKKWFREMKSELKKVVWPTPKQFTKNTAVALAVMFAAAILSSSLTSRIKTQSVQTANKAYQTEVLLSTSQLLQKAEDRDAILNVMLQQLNRRESGDVVFLFEMGKTQVQVICSFRESVPEKQYLQGSDTPSNALV